MFEIHSIIDGPEYALSRKEKDALFSEGMGELTRKHYAGCPEYGKIIDLIGFNKDRAARPEEFPFLPVRLFKEYDLLSVERKNIVKTLTSSGTTGQRVSRIFLDRDTSSNQTKALVKIASSFLGSQRLPMLIIDSPAIIKDRNMFSARGAGILGFSMLGRDHTYALNEDMMPDMKIIKMFINRHVHEKILLFGFTFMIWEHFFNHLNKMRERIDIDEGIVVHGGGWKKLIEKSVDNETFKRTAKELCGIQKVHNYYGMVEQAGSIFMECEHGRLHSSVFSDVIIREAKDFSARGPGEKGIIQLLSLLPASYPGHSILSEDMGEIAGIDDCPCGRKGKYFLVHGRLKNAEIRGCSDIYAASK